MRLLATLILFLASCATLQGPPLQLMVQGQPRSIERAQIHSVENDNSRFAIVLWSSGPTGTEQLLDCVLVGGGIELASNGGSGGEEQGQHWFEAKRGLALELADRLGVRPLEREDPELALVLSLPVPPDTFLEGAGLSVTVRITNNGPRSVAFQTGGRWANGGRDNRFDFRATRNGEGLPEPPLIYDFGGLGSAAQLGPGEFWESEVDLADWFPVDGPGVYRVEASFELDLQAVDPAPWGAGDVGYGPLWSSELRGVFQFELHSPL